MIGVGLYQNWVMYEPRLGQHWARIGQEIWPGIDQDWARIRPGLRLDWGMIGPGLSQDCGRIEQGL